MTERDGGLDGVLDPFGDDSWVSTEWKMLLNNMAKSKMSVVGRVGVLSG